MASHTHDQSKCCQNLHVLCVSGYTYECYLVVLSSYVSHNVCLAAVQCPMHNLMTKALIQSYHTISLIVYFFMELAMDTYLRTRYTGSLFSVGFVCCPTIHSFLLQETLVKKILMDQLL